MEHNFPVFILSIIMYICIMKFRLPRQEISQKLTGLGNKKIKENKIWIPVATKKILNELSQMMQKICQYGLPKHLVCKKLKNKLGFGIFLHPKAKPILKGELIAPYSGEVFIFAQNDEDTTDYAFALIPDLHLSKKEQLEWDSTRRYHPRRLYSIDLDAKKKGNFTRFINHSDKPNVEAKFLRIPTNSFGLIPAPFELFYVAKKIIRPGEQLLVSYEPEEKHFWGAIKPFSMTPKSFRLNSSLEVVESSPSP